MQRHLLLLALCFSLMSVVRARGCGMVFYYHVPKCGGTSIKQAWSKKVDEFVHFEAKGNEGHASWEALWSKVEAAANRTVKAGHLGQPFWAFAASHYNVPGMYWSLGRVLDLRRRVQAAECRFILFTILRDPYTRFWSSYFFRGRDGVFQIPTDVANRQDFVLHKGGPVPQSSFILYSDICNKTVTANDTTGKKKVICRESGRHGLQSVDADDMEYLLNALDSHFDFVGRTAELQKVNDALSLLMGTATFVSGHANPTVKDMRGYNETEVLLKLKQLEGYKQDTALFKHCFPNSELKM